MFKTNYKGTLLSDVADISFGISLTRVSEDNKPGSAEVKVYSAEDHQANVSRSKDRNVTRKMFRTSQTKGLLEEGDVVFSLLSNSACIIPKCNAGMMLSSNFALIRTIDIDPAYLMFLLNEDPQIQEQYLVSSQGSFIKRTSIADLKKVELPQMPDMETQKKIGEIYLKSLDLYQMKKQRNELEQQAILNCLRKASYGE